MNWKKYTIILIGILSTIFISREVIKACADYDYYDSYPSFYGNEISNKPDFYPFNYVETDLYYNDYWGKNGQSFTDSIDQLQVLKEWQDYIGQVSLGEIKDLLYNTSAETFTKENLKKYPANRMAQWLQKKDHSNVLQYLKLAKQCEAWVTNKSDEWNSDQPIVTGSSEQISTAIVSGLKSVKDPFLRMKYVFQLVRLAFYNKEYQKVLSLENQYLNGVSNNSTAYTQLLGYKAGAYYHTNNKVDAGYYYTKMFDNGEAYKLPAMISFTWSVDGSWEETFQKVYELCQNDHERAVALVMRGLRNYTPGFDDARQAYKLDPKVTGIDVLINREINKLESNYFIYKVEAQNQLQYPHYANIYVYWPSERSSTDSLDLVFLPKIKALNQFIDKLIQDQQNGSPSLWHITKAYLACMSNDKTGMQNELNAAQSLGMNSYEQSVYQVVELLNIIYQAPKITEATETALLPRLQELEELGTKNYHAAHQFGAIMKDLIAGRYLQQKDTIKAIYAMGHSYFSYYDDDSNQYASESDFSDLQGEILNQMSPQKIDRVIAFREKAGSQPFNSWLVGRTYYTKSVLKELMGVQYMRNGDYAAAQKIFLDSGGGGQTFPNPFMPHIGEQYELEHKDTLRKYTRLTFSKRMAELKAIIQKNPNDAGALYGYAVALFNLSYYGKSGNLISYSRHYTDPSGYYKTTEDSKMPRYLLEYYRVYSAEQYFNKVVAVTNDPELKAQALWGAAKCWSKRSPGIENRPRYWDAHLPDPYFSNALQNPYFRKLSANFSETRYVQQIEGACEYYRIYLKRN